MSSGAVSAAEMENGVLILLGKKVENEKLSSWLGLQEI
jgi:hypothetical protein